MEPEKDKPWRFNRRSLLRTGAAMSLGTAPGLSIGTRKAEASGGILPSIWQSASIYPANDDEQILLESVAYPILISVVVDSDRLAIGDTVEDPQLRIEVGGGTIAEVFTNDEGYDDPSNVDGATQINLEADSFATRDHHAVTVVVVPDDTETLEVTATPGADGEWESDDRVGTACYNVSDGTLSAEELAVAADYRGKLADHYADQYEKIIEADPWERQFAETVADVTTTLAVNKATSYATAAVGEGLDATVFDDSDLFDGNWLEVGFDLYGLRDGLTNTAVASALETAFQGYHDLAEYSEQHAADCAGTTDEHLRAFADHCRDERDAWEDLADEDTYREDVVQSLETQLEELFERDTITDEQANDILQSSVFGEANKQRRYSQNSNRTCDGFQLELGDSVEEDLIAYFESVIEYAINERGQIEDTLRFARRPNPTVATTDHEGKIGHELRNLVEGTHDESYVDVRFEVSNSGSAGLSSKRGFLSISHSEALTASTVVPFDSEGNSLDGDAYDLEIYEPGEEIAERDGGTIKAAAPLIDLSTQYEPGTTIAVDVRFQLANDELTDIDDEVWIDYRAAFEPVIPDSEPGDEEGFVRDPWPNNDGDETDQQGWPVYRVSSTDAPSRPRARLAVEGDDRATVGDTVTFHADETTTDPETEIDSFDWTIDADGEGINDGSTLEYTFEEPGRHRVEVTVEDTHNESDTAEVVVTVEEPEQLRASFNMTPSVPKPGDSVRFEAFGAGDDVEHEWVIDGDPETGQEVTRTFDEAGTYEVTLLATRGDKTEETTTDVTVASFEERLDEPRARIDGPTTLEVGEEGTWDGLDSYHPSQRDNQADDDEIVEIVEYEWNVGDTTTESISVSRSFEEPGERSIELTVTDENGLKDSTDWSVAVAETDDDERHSDAGEEIWRTEIGNHVHTSPTVTEDIVLVGKEDPSQAENESLYALDPSSGEIRWALETQFSVLSSPTLVNGIVFVGTHDNLLYAVDAESGTIRWRFEADDYIQSSPTVKDGMVFFGSHDESVYALDANSSAVDWTFKTDGAVESSPTVLDGMVFVGSRDSCVYALDADSGTPLWEFETESMVNTSPTVGDETVYVGSWDGNVYALDAASGEEKWTFQTGDAVRSSPTVMDGVVFFGSDDGNVYALDAESGEEYWTFDAQYDHVSGDPIPQFRSSPTVASGSVFIGNDQGKVYALDLESGEKRWSFETEGNVRSSPTVVDGVVFVGSDDGYVYAIDAGIDGSSEDSRVKLGTLGHHHVWADQQWDVTDDLPVVVGDSPPKDLDGDGLYEDVNGDGSANVVDVQALHQNLASYPVQDHSEAFNFSGEDPNQVTEADVQALYEKVTGGEDDV